MGHGFKKIEEVWYEAPSLRATYPSPRLWVLTWASVPDTAFSQGSRWAESLWGVRLPSCWQVQKAGAWFQASHSTRGLCSHLIPQSTLVCVSLCSHAHTLVSDLVVCLSALWRDLLVCVSLSFRGVDGARDPASNQLKTFSLEALGPEGSRLGCRSCHGVPEDGGCVRDPGPGHDGGRDPCVPLHDVWAGKDRGGLWSCPLPLWSLKH